MGIFNLFKGGEQVKKAGEGVEKALGGLSNLVDTAFTSKEEKLEWQSKINDIRTSFEKFLEQSVTDRLISDNQQDSWLPKNIRPLTLAFFSLVIVVCALIDVVQRSACLTPPDNCARIATPNCYVVPSVKLCGVIPIGSYIATGKNIFKNTD